MLTVGASKGTAQGRKVTGDGTGGAGTGEGEYVRAVCLATSIGVFLVKPSKTGEEDQKLWNVAETSVKSRPRVGDVGGDIVGGRVSQRDRVGRK